MEKYVFARLLILLLNLGTLLTSLASSRVYCPPPPPPQPHHHVKPPLPPKHTPKIKPPFHHTPFHHTPPSHPKPPTPYLPKPPVVKPPYVPKPPVVTPSPPPHVPKPPVQTPCPPPPPPPTPCPPPPPPKATPSPVVHKTCPIDTLKLGACVDVLGGLVHVGLGESAKQTCCPVLHGLVDLDAALCLCTAIKANLLNINLIIPVALELLVACGKSVPSAFKCPA